jgi:short-subunit dehydrogenase
MNTLGFFGNKVVLVTGSSRGIGREIARQLLAAGARVVLNGRDSATLEATRARLGNQERTMAVVADVSRPEEAEYLVATILTAWGHLDVLVNNAGLSMRGAFADLKPVTARTMIEANFFSAVWTTLAALPSLRLSRGRVGFVSSLAGLRGFPNVSLYSASKMALTALQQSLSAEEGSRGLKFSLVFLPFTENDLEKTILSADGTSLHHERPWSFSQAKAARAILQALAHGRKRTTLTINGRALLVAQSLFPALVDRLLRATKGKLHLGRSS